VPQTNKQTNKQDFYNLGPHYTNFCFRRRTKLYGALRAPIISDSK
jgi:hypothetical protein